LFGRFRRCRHIVSPAAISSRVYSLIYNPVNSYLL